MFGLGSVCKILSESKTAFDAEGGTERTKHLSVHASGSLLRLVLLFDWVSQRPFDKN